MEIKENDLDLLEGILKDTLSIFFIKYFVFLGVGVVGRGGGIPELYTKICQYTEKFNKRHFACVVS